LCTRDRDILKQKCNDSDFIVGFLPLKTKKYQFNIHH